MSELSEILLKMDSGDLAAAERLWPLVYEELRRIAANKLAQERAGQTLQPTALVHEAYLKLVGNANQPHWNSRGHFFSAAAEAMRRILVDRARQKLGPKRGGSRRRVDFDEAQLLTIELDQHSELLAIDEALELLRVESPIKAELVKLRFFAGLSHQEAAALLGISRATADRHWAYAKAFLFDALDQSELE